MTKPPFRYFGGKGLLASTIVDLMPPHRVYLEPYAGSAAVFLAKPPAIHEILNDRNAAIVAFFRTLRDDRDRLIEAIKLTPYARDEYLAADLTEEGLDDLELARRWWIRANAGVQGIVVDGRINFSASTATGGGLARTMKAKIDRLSAIADRLTDALIDNRDAVAAVSHYADRPDAVIYADPPYLGETRQGPGGYRVDARGHEHHRALAEALHASRGFVILSGYASPLYDDLFGDWPRLEIPRLSRGAKNPGDKATTRTEVLWTNRPLEGRLDLAGPVS